MNNQTQIIVRLATIAGLALTAATAQAATIIEVGTTGVYDPNNRIENQYPASSLASFKTAVSAAYTNNLGGSIDWEDNRLVTQDGAALGTSNTSANNDLQNITARYGAGAGDTLAISFDLQMALYRNDVAGQVSSLTGTNSLLTFGVNTVAYTMTFGAGVVEIGAGALSRSTYGTNGVDFRATATFSGAGTSAIDYLLGGTAGGSDSFLHFAAPAGQTISSLRVEYIDDNGGNLTNGQRRPVLDDFGFIVVPEPSSSMLIGLSFLTVALIRRR